MAQVKQAEKTKRSAAQAAKAQPAQKPSLWARVRDFFFIFGGRMDLPLLTLVIILLLFGLVVLFSASYPSGYLYRGDSYAFILPQLRTALGGVAVMLAVSRVNYNLLRRYAWQLMAGTGVLLLLVLFTDEINGAKRWLFGFQPSEVAKFAVIVLFAAVLAANQEKMKGLKNGFVYGFMPLMVVLGIVLFLLYKQPHLSCMILILGIAYIMMTAGGTNPLFLIGTIALGVLAVLFVLQFAPDVLPDYAHERLATWQDPFADSSDSGHQTIQGLIAIGSGGLTGTGIGHSVQKFFYLPEIYNDYIFAVLCEELGFIGAVAVIVLFLLLLLRGLYIALRLEDKFASLLVVGVSAQIALQAFLHIAVNTNAIPSTGISMPFFSSGGTSLLMLMGEVGIMLNVSRFVKRPAVAAEAPAPAEAAGEAP